MPTEVFSDADILRVPAGPGALHVERYGRGGAIVVLLHGFGTCAFLWRTLGPALARAGFTALAIDLLGYGESDRPYDADYGIAAQAEYVDRALTSLRVAQACIIGIDVGGGVALRLAATRADRVNGLVLINSLAFDAVPAGDVKAMQRATARFALRLSRGVLGAAPVLRSILTESVAESDHMPDRLVGRYLAPYVGRDGVPQLLALARALRASDLKDLDLRTIRVPTLIIRGERDRWLDDRTSQQLAAAIPGSRLLRIPGAARLVPEDEPDQLAAAVLDFLVPDADLSRADAFTPLTGSD